MDLHEHIEASVVNPEHDYDVPMTHLRMVWRRYIEEVVIPKAGRNERNREQSRSRRRAGRTGRDAADAAVTAAGMAVAQALGIEYIGSALLSTKFPVEQNGEVVKLADFTIEMIDKRIAMLEKNAAGIVEDIGLMQYSRDLLSQTGARTVGEAVAHAFAA